MKHKISLTFIIVCFAANSFAQTAHNWTGFYIGPNIGAAYSKLLIPAYNQDFSQISGINVPNRGIVIVPGTEYPIQGGSATKTSFTGGIQLGYMRQYHDWAFGLEADANYLSVTAFEDRDDSLPATALVWHSAYGFHRKASVQLTESIRAKIGHVMNNSLAYLTVGAAFAGMKATAMDYWNAPGYWAQPWIDNAPHPKPTEVNYVGTSRNQSSNLFGVGLSIGAGYEKVFSDIISAAVEYRYSMPSANFTTTVDTTTPAPTDSRPVYRGVIGGSTQKMKLTTNQLTVRLNINLDPLINPGSKSNNNSSGKKVKGK
jgi:opacity protein-like surface antigen